MGKKILVVDDDELVVIAIQELLTPLGFMVETAAHGAGALEKVSRHRYDLVVLDVIMPEMDGVEVCRRIRAMDAYSAVPILMLTAKSGEEDRQRGTEAGANLYLSKPIAPRRLIALVEEALK